MAKSSLGEIAAVAQNFVHQADAFKKCLANRRRTVSRMLVMMLRTVTFMAACC